MSKPDIILKDEGYQVLRDKMGMVDAERFIAIIKKEAFDYTKWQETLWEGLTVEEISDKAAALRENENK